MKKFQLYLGIAAVLVILCVHPLLGAAKLPEGLYEAVSSSLGTSGWRVFSETQQLIAADGSSSDHFGYSIALDGDTALVGARQNGIGANANQGSVYVFVREGETWIEQSNLISEDGAPGDAFGSSVDLDGDTALIGAEGDNIDSHADQGSAYVFVRNGTTWTQQAKLIADDGSASDLFGSKVDLDGDTVLITAFGDDIDANANQGSAYVFVRNGTTWTQQQKLIASDGASSDSFGSDAALDGDTALIGAFADDINSINNQGSAYVFVRSGTTWSLQTKLISNDGLEDDLFGFAVALDNNTALIGAVADDIGANTNQGSVYVFVRSGTTWTQQAQLTASDGAVDDSLGTSLVVENDTALIGAKFDDIDANTGQGSAYVFVRSGTFWVQQTKLIASNGTSNALFGFAVALDDSVAMVGATFDTIAGNIEQGSVYAFVDPDLVPTPTAEFTETPTETPTVETTPTPEPGTIELIVNGGFEAADAAPWTIKNASGDKVKCNKDKDGDGIPDKIVAYTGNCAFQLKNVIGEAGKIQQTLDLSAVVPTVGDTLNLSFFAQSKGGATVKFTVVFKYPDDTKTKLSVESSGLETYTAFTGSGTLTNTTIVKSKISGRSTQTSGKVLIDDVTLLYTPSNLIGLPVSRITNHG